MSLPVGAGYSNRSGQASVNARRVEGDSIIITSTCDSLARQVVMLTEELTRIRNDTEKQEKLPETKVVKEPTGWQWFQIWIGRIAVALFILILVKRRLSSNQKE